VANANNRHPSIELWSESLARFEFSCTHKYRHAYIHPVRVFHSLHPTIHLYKVFLLARSLAGCDNPSMKQPIRDEVHVHCLISRAFPCDDLLCLSLKLSKQTEDISALNFWNDLGRQFLGCDKYSRWKVQWIIPVIFHIFCGNLCDRAIRIYICYVYMIYTNVPEKKRTEMW